MTEKQVELHCLIYDNWDVFSRTIYYAVCRTFKCDLAGSNTTFQSQTSTINNGNTVVRSENICRTFPCGGLHRRKVFVTTAAERILYYRLNNRNVFTCNIEMPCRIMDRLRAKQYYSTLTRSMSWRTYIRRRQ